MGNARMRAEQINYGATNVKVALDDLDPKDLISLSARMDTIEAWKATVKAEEKTGASVEYTNALALPAVSVSAEIVASQDLHGYDKPWVGGSGKNKLENNNAQNTEVNGITVTVDSQGVIDLDGTATANTFIYTQGTGWGAGTPPTTLVNGQTYTLGYGHTDAEMGSMRFALYGLKNDDTIFSACADASAPFTHQFVYDDTITSFFAYIRIMNGTHLDHFKLYPQIEQGTSETTFAPYTNICPISGFSSVVITDVDAESHTATVTVSLGSTVYGGTLDLTSGELTISHGEVDLGSLSWVYDSGDRRFNAVLSGIKDVTFRTLPMKCSCYDVIDDGTPFAQLPPYCIYNNGTSISVHDARYTDAALFTTAVTGQTLVYPLATPTTTTLTAAELEMVKGYNHISANSGDITVKAYTGAPWGGDTI